MSVPSTCSDWPEGVTPPLDSFPIDFNMRGEPIDVIRHASKCCYPCHNTEKSRRCKCGKDRSCRRGDLERCHHDDHRITIRQGKRERAAARSFHQLCPRSGGDAEVQGETTMLVASETDMGVGSSLRPAAVCPLSQAFVAQDNQLDRNFATKTCGSKTQISKLTQLCCFQWYWQAAGLGSLCCCFQWCFGVHDARVLHTICNNGLTEAAFRDSARGSVSWVVASGYTEFIRKQTPEVQGDYALLGSLWRKLESSQRLDFRTSEALVVQALASMAVDRGSVRVCSFRFTSWRDLPHHEVLVIGLPMLSWEQMREMASEAYNRSKSSNPPRFISQQKAPNNLDDKDLFLTLGSGPDFFAVAHSNRLAHWYEDGQSWEKGHWMPYNGNEATWSVPGS